MSLLLSHKSIGEGWHQMAAGDIAGLLDQWCNLNTKIWEPLPLEVVGLPCRFANMWRSPEARAAKVEAIWAAKANLFKYFVSQPIRSFFHPKS